MANTPFFGNISPPTAYQQYGASGGLITFLNNAMQLAIIAGGIWTLINLTVAGLQYISAKGDPKQMGQVVQTMTGSLIGIALMILAPAIMGILGFVIFRDATYFITPKITGPGGTP